MSYLSMEVVIGVPIRLACRSCYIPIHKNIDKIYETKANTQFLTKTKLIKS